MASEKGEIVDWLYFDNLAFSFGAYLRAQLRFRFKSARDPTTESEDRGSKNAPVGARSR
jgi:hypothetical protein